MPARIGPYGVHDKYDHPSQGDLHPGDPRGRRAGRLACSPETITQHFQFPALSIPPYQVLL
jgi:hypothetical protein